MPPNTAPSEPFSLFNALTKTSDPSAGVPGATNLISKLLELAAEDVCAFKRNTQVSFRIVSRARDVRNKINDLIKKTEAATSNDWASFEAEWQDYEIYSSAIDPLEQQLFKFVDISFTEASLHLPNDNDMPSCLDSLSKWTESRKSLRQALKTLTSTPEFVKLQLTEVSDAERTAAGKRDDTVFLSSLVSNFPDHLDANGVFSAVKDKITTVKTRFESLQAKLKTLVFDDELFELGGKCGMLVFGALKVARDSSDRNWKLHLSSSDVWTSAEVLLSEFVTTVNAGTPTLQDVKAKYEAFKAKIETLPKAVLPEALYDLPKKAGKIRRPYLARSHAFICACRTLAKQFSESADQVETKAIPLERAIEETLKALGAAANAMTQIQSFDAGKMESNDAGKAFKDAETMIEKCFAEYGLQSKWATEKKILDNAAAVDKQRIDKMNKLLEQHPHPPPPPENASSANTDIQMNISVCDHSFTDQAGERCDHGKGKAIRKSRQYYVKSTELLSALLWKEGSDFPDDRARLEDGHSHFEQQKGKSLPFSTMVGSLKSKGGVCMLRLVLE